MPLTNRGDLMKKYIVILMFVITLFSVKQVYAKEGWATENGEKYYYENGEKVSGWKTIDGETYFFGLTTKKLLHGWQYWNGKFYLDENGKVTQGWNTIDGETYYVKDNYMVNEFQNIDGETYFFGLTTYKLLHGWQYWNGKFYLDGKGKVTQGWNTIDGEKYYVRDNYMVNEFQNIDGETYFFGLTTYKLLHGWQNWNGKFYLDENGKVTQGWNTIDGEKYYVRDNYMVNEFQNIDGENYFFGLTTYKLLHGWQNWNGKFYLDSEGKTKEGINEIDGAKYFVKDKYIVNGFQRENGKIYFFGLTTNKLLYGWQSTGKDTYWYQDDTGALVTGAHNIDGRDYVFNEETGLLDGFKTVNNKLYYYDPDGTLNKGIQYIARRFLKFDANTGEYEKIVRQIRVIDISTHNGQIDWNTVKASNQVDGVILRLGYGQGYMDSRFLYNKGELERLGIPYSVYLFSYAEKKSEAQKEADFVVRAIQQNAVNIAYDIFAVYYDLEDWEIRSTGENSYGINQDTYGEMITTFVNTIEKELGVRGRVYASKNYIETRFPTYAQGYATWVAQWNDTITYKGNYEGWQYTSTGSVPGINGNVDMNIFYY